MQRFVHHENIALYKKLMSESALDPSRDEDRHKMLLRLFAEEKAKEFATDATGTIAELEGALSGAAPSPNLVPN